MANAKRKFGASEKRELELGPLNLRTTNASPIRRGAVQKSLNEARAEFESRRSKILDSKASRGRQAIKQAFEESKQKRR